MERNIYAIKKFYTKAFFQLFELIYSDFTHFHLNLQRESIQMIFRLEMIAFNLDYAFSKFMLCEMYICKVFTSC